MGVVPYKELPTIAVLSDIKFIRSKNQNNIKKQIKDPVEHHQALATPYRDLQSLSEAVLLAGVLNE